MTHGVHMSTGSAVGDNPASLHGSPAGLSPAARPEGRAAGPAGGHVGAPTGRQASTAIQARLAGVSPRHPFSRPGGFWHSPTCSHLCQVTPSPLRGAPASPNPLMRFP